MWTLGLVEEANSWRENIFFVAWGIGPDGPQPSARGQWLKQGVSMVGGVGHNLPRPPQGPRLCPYEHNSDEEDHCRTRSLSKSSTSDPRVTSSSEPTCTSAEVWGIWLRGRSRKKKMRASRQNSDRHQVESTAALLYPDGFMWSNDVLFFFTMSHMYSTFYCKNKWCKRFVYFTMSISNP